MTLSLCESFPVSSFCRVAENMVLDSVSSWISSRLGRLRERLLERVVWTVDDGRSLALSSSPGWALVTIWGRERYREIYRDYPINRWSDAIAVARAEAVALEPCMLTVGNFIEGRRRVTFYCLDKNEGAATIKALFWLPETVLLNAALSANTLATIERGDVKYFLCDGESQLAGGVIQTAERFALASGMRGGWQAIKLDEVQAREILPQGLTRLDRAVWSTALSPDLRLWFATTRRPLMVGLTFLLAFYMLIVSSYVSATLMWRENSVEKISATVTPLLATQKKVELLRRERAALLRLHQERKPVLPVWGGLDAIWRAGGVVQAITWSEKNATVRGRAAEATVVLAALREVPQIKGARFSSAVRQESGNQEFSIQFEIDSSVPMSVSASDDKQK